MKTNLKQIRLYMVFIYPLINILICFLSKGDNMNILSTGYCILIILLSFKINKIDKKTIITIIILSITVLITGTRETDRIGFVSSLTYSATILMFIVYSEKYIGIDELTIFSDKHEKLFYLVQSLYIFVLLIHVAIYGFVAGWNTYILQGPYNYPHTLAYFLELMIMVDVYYWIKKKTKLSMVLLIISEGAVFLTAVRTVLLSTMVVALFVIYKLINKKRFDKLLGIIMLGIMSLCIAYKYGILDSLIAKTKLALSNSTITNGRFNIAASSLKALNKKDGISFINYITGVGMSQLMASNNKLLYAPIHAHNDIIDVLVCYGIVNLWLYIKYFYKFAKTNLFWICGTIGILVISNGLFPYIDCIPILIFTRLLL